MAPADQSSIGCCAVPVEDSHSRGCQYMDAKAAVVADRGARPGSDERHREAEASVEVLLRAVGEDPSREGLLKTPSRVVKAFRAAMQGMNEMPAEILKSALFSEDGTGQASGRGGGSGGTVIIRDIECFSTCCGCLLPFRIVCHVAYIPRGNKVVGLSKIPRAAVSVARQLQSPQQFVSELCEAVTTALSPAGVAVIAEATHLVNLEDSVTVNRAAAMDKVSGRAQRSSSENLSPAEQLNGCHMGSSPSTSSSPPWDHGSGHKAETTGGFEATIRGWAARGSPGWHAVEAVSGRMEEERVLEETLLMLRVSGEVTSCLKQQRLKQQQELSPRSSAGTTGNDSLWGCPYVRHTEKKTDLWLSISGVLRELASECTNDCMDGRTMHMNGDCTPVTGNSTLMNNCRMNVNGQQRVRGFCGALGAARTLLQKITGAGHSRRASCSPHDQFLDAAMVEHAAQRYVGYLIAATTGYMSDVTVTCNQGKVHDTRDETGAMDTIVYSRAPTFPSLFGPISFFRGPVSSLCEHHLLPFFGSVNIWHAGSSGEVHGLGRDSSSLDPEVAHQIVLKFSRRLQVQERLTKEVAEAVSQMKGHCGVMVVLEAWHMCMSVRGVERPGASTTTMSTIGCFSEDYGLRSQCLQLLPDTSTTATSGFTAASASNLD